MFDHVHDHWVIIDYTSNMATAGPHISISAEPLASVGTLTITNSMLTSFLVSGLLIIAAVYIRANLSSTGKPTKIQNIAELIIEFLHNMIHSVTGNLEKTRLFFPVIATFFLFIIANNWIGLIPGVGSISLSNETSAHSDAEDHSFSLIDSVNAATESEFDVHEDENVPEVMVESHAITVNEVNTEVTNEGHDNAVMPAVTDIDHDTNNDGTDDEAETEHHVAPMLFRAATADINTTLALALVSVIFAQYFGLKKLSLGYLKKFINFSSPIMFVVGILELVSEFAKIISFAFRLYGNVFAGEVLLAVIIFLTPIFVPILPLPFYGLEVFVGFIQALVFSMLSLVFFNMATQSHDH